MVISGVASHHFVKVFCWTLIHLLSILVRLEPGGWSAVLEFVDEMDEATEGRG